MPSSRRPAVRASHLLAVSARTRDDAWAVGAWRDPGEAWHALAAHWDGSRWTVVPSPSPGSGAVLAGVAMVASDDVWAVGHSVEAGESVALIEHWDGTSWSVAGGSDLRGRSLLGVSAAASDDVWAVGEGLTEHWDGSAWSVVPGSGGADAVSAVSGDAWALDGTVVQRWDGQGWGSVTQPTFRFASGNRLRDLAVLSARDVWAVGEAPVLMPGNQMRQRPLAAHWDGERWTLTAPPGQSPAAQRLEAVSAVAAGDVWAVGTLVDSGNSLIDHWNGTAWTRVDPHFPLRVNTLQDVSALADGSVFAVGYESVYPNGSRTVIHRLCEVRVTDAAISPPSVTLRARKAIAWTVDTATGSSHRLVEREFGQLDSGDLGAGDSFSHTFTVSGTYQVTDTATGAAQTIGVPLSVPTAPWGPEHRFVVQSCSRASLPAGVAVDVEVQRPGEDRFTEWKVAATIASAGDFTPDAGPGTYRFRARLRRLDGTATSAWSPVRSVPIG